MFERFLSFLAELPAGGDRQGEGSSQDDPRVAAAALLFHVMEADGVREEAEESRLQAVLSEAYGVTGKELDAIVQAGERAEREAVDLYVFTSVLKRELGEEARAEFIGIMWEVVLADGELHELEDNIVWRVAELIGIDTRERVLQRRRVQQNMPDADPDDG